MPQVSMNRGGTEPTSQSSMAEHKQNIENKVSSGIQQVSEKLGDQYTQVQDYIQRTDLQGTMRDVSQLIRRHPVASAAIGITVGLFVGRLLRR